MENPSAVGMVLLAFGVIVTIVGGVFGMAAAIKKLFFEKIDPKQQFVTREELHTQIGEIETKLDGLKLDLHERMNRMSDYARQTAHEQANSMNSINLKVERLLALREADMLHIQHPQRPQHKEEKDDTE